MRIRVHLWVVAAALVGAAAVASGAGQSARELFERARLMEAAKQSPAEVIKLYEQAAAAAEKSDPALAVAANDAISRLTAQPTERVLWTGADMPRGGILAVSPDGRTVATSRSGSLVLRDVATGEETALTKAEPRTQAHAESVVYAAFSTDGKRIAYDWRIQHREGGQETIVDELRVLDLGGSGLPAPRVLFRDEQTEGYSVRPVGWTPDGSQIAVVIGHFGDRTRKLGLVATKDGALTVLRSLDWRNATGVSLSPDGRYIAFDLPADEHTAQRDVFVLAVDGSQQVTAVGGPWRDQVVGWSPDGGQLLFTRDQRELWAQPMVAGRPQGNPSLLKADAPGTMFMLTATGTLFEGVRVDDRAIHTAPVDFATGRSLGPATPVPGPWPSPNNPAWSPDGTSIASIYNIASDNVVAIQTLKTGDTRILSLPIAALAAFRWTPDGQGFLVQALDLNGRDGLYRIDLQSGAMTPLLLPPPGVRYFMPQLSPDGSRLYGARTDGGSRSFFIEHDLTRKTDRELFPLTAPPSAYGTMSPDGRFVVTTNRIPVDGKNSVFQFVVSLSSTTDRSERELLRVDQPAQFLGGPVAEWTADSQFAIVRKSVGQGRCELWSIRVADAQAQKLDVGVPNLICNPIQVSPIPVGDTGGHVAFLAGSPVRPEIRVIEGFLPAAKR